MIYQQFTFMHSFTMKDISVFTHLVGDSHPLHQDTDYAKSKGFKTLVVPGMLTASLFSRIIGNYLPRNNYFYISQSLVFHQPVYPEEPLTVLATINQESLSTGILTLDTKIYQDKTLVLSGEARAKPFVK